jgi:integrase
VTDAKFDALKGKADPTYRAIIELVYLTAMRRGDIIDLRLADITDDGIFVRQNKTGHRQRFTWSAELTQVIKRAKGACKTRNIEFLFTSRHGKPISPTAFNSAWRRLREKASLLDVYFHD